MSSSPAFILSNPGRVIWLTRRKKFARKDGWAYHFLMGNRRRPKWPTY